ncbi:bifunctional diguanylate cyclase/phosphodiesterase [Aureimonas sp. AU20]|uniref:putative bifunctional diguanylate cyclase/phosphodiesterase n=1 Tax=Aureimonas sp. AU20 TaxID=1349819 RepID=UPI00071F0D82|nr:bifunctional diguanylate cyclase/phosphodiesterase [Aureimonas sp. AU20]ALN73867.1 hypothetical protein M673_14160 [Aureimonas sp. AU20]
MLRKLGRKYASTVAGAIALLAVVAAAGFYAGQGAVESLVQGEVETRAQRFASFLLENGPQLDALLTGLSRTADAEVEARNAGAAANLVNFSIFDANGHEVFTPRSTRQEWLLRERPGGTATGVSLSTDYLEKSGPWIAVDGASGSKPTATLPLFRDGQRIGFLSVSPDMAEERQRFVSDISSVAASLFGAAILAIGVPAAIFFLRRRMIEQVNERIEFLDNFDPLTHLLNRKRFQERADGILATSRATRERMALWAINVTSLSDINSGMGQQVGDELLRTLSERIGAVIDKADLFGRMSGGDFRLLQRNNLSGVQAVETLAQKIRETVEMPIEIAGHTIVPKLAIGVSLVPDHGRNISDIERHADLARTAHTEGKSGFYAVFDPSMDVEAHRRRQIERDMRIALKNDRFELFYQPIVGASDGVPKGYEALIRLPDDQGGFISPGEFIPIAEARDLMKPISDFVIDESIRQIALWPEHLYMSINLSPAQFQDNDLVEIVSSALQRHGVSGNRLQIEVVETLLLERSDIVLHQLRGLKQLGISIAMDDFGTGYSSLGYLWRFPFDTLKIDQSFMLAFDAGEANVRQILETIISLAHNLGMRVTTEGVETAEQARMLAALHCDSLQGFHFSRPKPARQIDIAPNATLRKVEAAA